MDHWLSNVWETAFWCKNYPMLFLCLILIHVFAQVLIIIFRYVFPFNSDNSLFKPFFLQLHLCLFSDFYYLFFRDISLNSQEQFILFSVTFHLIFNGLSFILLLFELFFWNYPTYVHLFIRSLSLFLLVFLSCLAMLFIISCSC